MLSYPRLTISVGKKNSDSSVIIENSVIFDELDFGYRRISDENIDETCTKFWSSSRDLNLNINFDNTK